MATALATPYAAVPVPVPVPASVPDTSLHPVVALRAIRQLFRAPGDTRQVFIVLQAMRGRSGQRIFARFIASDEGAAILADRPSLLDHLTDRAALAALPEGTLGRGYLRFVTDAHLSPEGLVDAMQAEWTQAAPESVAFFRSRLRDSHDLAHVLTGYGSDVLGELCLLAFNTAQTGHPGMAMIAVLGSLRASTGPGGWNAGRPIRRAVFQAWRHGRAAAWLASTDWESALTRPLADLRRDMRITPPTLYTECAA